MRFSSAFLLPGQTRIQRVKGGVCLIMQKEGKMKLILITAGVFLLACQPDEAVNLAKLEGTFTGMFSRSGPLVRYQPADVVLTFEGNRFRGSSSISRYPAICEGTFEVDNGKIRFADACFWTADFDWTYILKGEFDLSITRDELTMNRSYDGSVYDRYSLRQQIERSAGR